MDFRYCHKARAKLGDGLARFHFSLVLKYVIRQINVNVIQ